MPLLLTILSVLAAWIFLTVLAIGLLLILTLLQSVRGDLERIEMGVRAIERQARSLGPHAESLAETLVETGGAADAAAERLGRIDRGLERAASGLRTR